MIALGAPLKKPAKLSGRKMSVYERTKIAKVRAVEEKGRNDALYGEMYPTVRFLRSRGWVVTRNGVGFALGNRTVDAKALKATAERERRLAGMAT